jgi:DNA repair exonuclease SbcCD nuclease subunit
MTRFIYIADTHVGADEGGYHQQPRYSEQLPELLQYLEYWIEQNPGIDFILHGGDMVDQVSVNSIRIAHSWFTLSVPTYLCLGNHDMTHPHAGDLWLTEAPEFFPNGSLDFTLTCDGIEIRVMPNHWCDTPVYWDGHTMKPHFTDDQIKQFEFMRSLENGIDWILCTHTEVCAVPMEQTGFSEPYHAPTVTFSDFVCDRVTRTPSLRCILSGHNHINTCVPIDRTNVQAITVSAFTESPFEFKVIDLEPGHMVMRTENLFNACGFRVNYDYNKTFVQGRLKDRAVDIRW